MSINIKLEWRDTTDFGYRYYFYLGETKVGHIGHLDHEPGEPQWSAGTRLPIPHSPYLGHFYFIASAKAEVEGVVDRFLIEAGIKEISE